MRFFSLEHKVIMLWSLLWRRQRKTVGRRGGVDSNGAQELNAICLLTVSICTSFVTKKTINVSIEIKKMYSKPFRQRLYIKPVNYHFNAHLLSSSGGTCNKPPESISLSVLCYILSNLWLVNDQMAYLLLPPRTNNGKGLGGNMIRLIML